MSIGSAVVKPSASPPAGFVLIGILITISLLPICEYPVTVVACFKSAVPSSQVTAPRGIEIEPFDDKSPLMASAPGALIKRATSLSTPFIYISPKKAEYRIKRSEEHTSELQSHHELV